jgi:hypothetical protein
LVFLSLSLSHTHARARRPRVVFLEVGLLPLPAQDAAAALLRSWGYVARRCGYGMELVATRGE